MRCSVYAGYTSVRIGSIERRLPIGSFHYRPKPNSIVELRPLFTIQARNHPVHHSRQHQRQSIPDGPAPPAPCRLCAGAGPRRPCAAVRPRTRASRTCDLHVDLVPRLQVVPQLVLPKHVRGRLDTRGQAPDVLLVPGTVHRAARTLEHLVQAARRARRNLLRRTAVRDSQAVQRHCSRAGHRRYARHHADRRQLLAGDVHRARDDRDHDVRRLLRSQSGAGEARGLLLRRRVRYGSGLHGQAVAGTDARPRVRAARSGVQVATVA